MPGKETGRDREEKTTRITERDVAALRWISEQYAITMDHLQLLLGMLAESTTKEPRTISLNRVRVIVTRWVVAGLVQQRKILYEHSIWVWPTVKGLHLVQSTYRMRIPQPGQLAHYYAINQVRLLFERHGVGSWRSERAMRAETRRLEREPSWHGKKLHIADGEWFLPTGERQAIEVELSLKTPQRIHLILLSLSTRYSRIWYVVATASMQREIEDAVAALEAEIRFRFVVQQLSELKGADTYAGQERS